MELSAFFADAGLVVPEPILDGTLRRVDHKDKPRKKTGWYVGHEMPFKVVVCGDWRNHSHLKWSEKKEVPKKQIKEALAKLAAAKFQAKLLREKEQEKTAEEAEKLWAAAQDGSRHPYLVNKKIDSYGLKKQGDILFVPMRDFSGKLWGIQRIWPDGRKLFLKGQMSARCVHVIDGTTDRVIVCEGYATGASIFAATGATVVCTFSASNMVKVSEIIRDYYPNHSITFAGDNDQWGDNNAGALAAKEAADKARAAYVLPKFKTDDGQPTDFNDLANREGISAVSAQLDAEIGLEKLMSPLGTCGSGASFYCFESQQVIRFASWSQAEFFHLQPVEYWREQYPKDEDDGDGVDWSQVKSDMIKAAKKVGPFDPFTVRGTGVWIDDSRVIVNTGDKLWTEGREIKHTKLCSNFAYIRDKRQIPLPDKPASVVELAPLVSALNLLRWERNIQKYYFGGWLAISRIAGALPIRPHLWLTGASGSGKSTALEQIVAPLIGKYSEYVLGATTEAGIRQAMQYASVPIIFDEFESATDRQKDRVGAVIELLRNGWSPTTGKVVKGSANGTAQAYTIQSPALVSSIGVNLSNEADESRFTVCELIKGHDPEQWDSLKAHLSHITPTLGDRLFSRMVNMVETVKRSYGVASEFLKASGISARLSSQYGMLLAGYSALVQDAPLTVASLEKLLPEISKETGEKVKDEEMALTTLLQQSVDLQYSIEEKLAQTEGDPPTVKATVGHLVSEVAKGRLEPYVKDLTRYGIKLEDGYLYFANTSPWIRKVLSQWPNWPKTLRRLPGVESRLTYMSGSTLRAQAIPLELLKSVRT